MEIDKVASAHIFRSCRIGHWLTSNPSASIVCLYLNPRIRSYPRSWASCWLLKHWLFSKCSSSEKSSHAGFMFYFSSCSPAKTSPHIILIRFLSSPAFTRDIKLYHRRTADIRRVGGDQLRAHYDPEIKTVCIVYIWQDKTTQLAPSELRLVLVIVLVRQTGGDQARRSEIWKACYHHHQATGRHRFYRKILHHNPCLTESP